MKQYRIRVACGCYITNCKVTLDKLEYDLTNSVEDAQRFYDADLKMVIAQLGSEGETADREEAEQKNSSSRVSQ